MKLRASKRAAQIPDVEECDMLKYSEHRPTQRSAEASAAQSWMEGQRRRQEKRALRRREEALFARRQRMAIAGRANGDRGVRDAD